MKEYPIIFNSEMVKAILDGHKTETRRVIKPQPGVGLINGKKQAPLCCKLIRCVRECDISPEQYDNESDWVFENERGGYTYLRTCPYGQPGDLLWVRETWMPAVVTGEFKGVAYKANWDDPGEGYETWFVEKTGYGNPEVEYDKWYFYWKKNPGIKWIPSIHMPRWASRILLEVAEIEVERVREITEASALKEGCSDNPYALSKDESVPTEEISKCEFAKARFRVLWDSINKKRGYGWDANPWCWVVKFKVKEIQ